MGGTSLNTNEAGKTSAEPRTRRRQDGSRRPKVQTPHSPSHAPGVLVVEHDPDLQWHLARALTVEGNRVVGTSSGDGALALAAQWNVDVALIEEHLPGMSGLDVAREFQRAHPHVSVVIMTADDSAELREEARSLGALAVLRKPLELDQVRSLVESLSPSAE